MKLKCQIACALVLLMQFNASSTDSTPEGTRKMEKITSLTQLDSAIMRKEAFFKVEDGAAQRVSVPELMRLSMLDVMNLMSSGVLFSEKTSTKLDIKTIVKSTIK